MIGIRPGILGVVVGALLVSTAGTSRGDLIGSTVQWQYYAFGSAYSPNGGGTFVDTGGIGGSFTDSLPAGSSYFDIAANGTSITFDYTFGDQSGRWSSSPLSLAPTIYNGIAVDVLSGSTITSVTIDPATNMVGFDASRFSFTGTEIQVDWQNLPFVAGQTIVKLDVNVPEPSSLVLGALGFVGVAAWGWRQRKRLGR
jgi:hypothetical protein